MTQTHNPVPVANAAFIETLSAFLRQEDADRFADMFENFVVAGGLHGPGAGLTHTPAPLTAYPAGFLVTETGAIPYTDAVTTWVICDPETTGNTGAYVRVAGTHYLTAISGAQPAVPATACPLMQVTTAGGSVTAVRDLRLRGPVQRLALPGVVFSGYYATLQEAVDALPAEGGTVYVEPGTYVLTETLTIGNGTAASISTQRGVVLRGVAANGTQLVGIDWQGGAAPMIQVRGPLVGWAIENLLLVGNDVATYGVEVVSGQYGRLENLDIHGCQSAGVHITSVSAASDVAISQHNHIANIAVNAAGDCGIDLDGLTAATSTQYNTFSNILIAVTGNGVGLRLGNAMNNTFTSLRVDDAGSATAGVQLAYDNGVTALCPAGNTFLNLEVGDVPWEQTGAPGDSLPPNLVLGLSGASSASDTITPDIDGLAMLYVVRETGNLHLLAAQNPTVGTPPVGAVVVGQVADHVRHLVPEIDGVAWLGTPTNRWQSAYLSGGVRTAGTVLTVSTLLTDAYHVVAVNAAGGAVTVTLTDPEDMPGQSYIIKKIDASANAVTVSAPTGGIDGAASTTLTAQWDALHVMAVETAWYIVGVGP